MLRSNPVIRVAARVLGTDSHLRNTLTQGRVDLSRLIGGGTDAPLRMAAIRQIGNTLCRASEMNCDECPLLQINQLNDLADQLGMVMEFPGE